MNAPWWPEGAPYPRQKLGELATFELRALITFAEDRQGDSADGARLAQFLTDLRGERAERAEFARRFAANAPGN